MSDLDKWASEIILNKYGGNWDDAEDTVKQIRQQFVERACAVVDDIAPRYYGLKFSKCYRHRIDTLEDTKQALRDEFK